jgi:hypothetical protein
VWSRRFARQAIVVASRIRDCHPNENGGRGGDRGELRQRRGRNRQDRQRAQRQRP